MVVLESLLVDFLHLLVYLELVVVVLLRRLGQLQARRVDFTAHLEVFEGLDLGVELG
jgi:hypothetical protein